MFLNHPGIKYRASLLTMMFSWQKFTTILCLATASATFALYHFEMLPPWIYLKPFPLAVIGGALGIFVSFRTNSCYQRWWEGRKLWGRLINTSRHVCTQAIAYLPEAEATETVYRQICYVHALRCGLRDEDPYTDEHMIRTLPTEENEALQGSTNLNHALLNKQMKNFVQWTPELINNFRLSDLDESIRHLLDIQGGCERIKKTPFPPAYGFLATRLTQFYACLLPLATVQELGFWVIPANLMICMAFQLINEVGRILETPFSTFWPALPLSAMSLTIERNLRQALGETDLPAPQAPINKGRVLM